MAFFLAFLALITIVVPMVTLSQPGRIGLSLIFVLTLVFGAFATIQHRILIYFVVALTIATLAVNLISEFAPSHSSSALETTLRLACLSILVFMTVKQTLRPGPVTVYRVMGGIAGYLLIGFTWSFAYQLVMHWAPSAIHFASAVEDIPARQPTHLIYFSFVTLTTVGYGDAYPVHPVARSLVVAEALTGQLYLAILIGSLVGMALQTKSVRADVGPSVEVQWGRDGLVKSNEPREQLAENRRH
jgi:voltage-gated potassium channel